MGLWKDPPLAPSLEVLIHLQVMQTTHYTFTHIYDIFLKTATHQVFC